METDENIPENMLDVVRMEYAINSRLATRDAPMAAPNSLLEFESEPDHGLPFDYFLNQEIWDELPEVATTGPIQEGHLYRDRLQSLIDRQMEDIETFALREGKTFDEVLRHVCILLYTDMDRVGQTDRGCEPCQLSFQSSHSCLQR